MAIEIHMLSASDTSVPLRMALQEMGLLDSPDVQLHYFQYPELYGDEVFKHQPYRKSPYLIDTATGLELYEARTMLKYLAYKYKSPLVPTFDASTPEYWHFDKMCSVDMTTVYPGTLTLMIEHAYAELLMKRPPSKDVLAFGEEQLNKALAGHEVILSKQKYLYNDEFSLVDLYELFMLDAVHDAGGAKSLTDGTFPHVQRWFEACRSRKSYVDAIAFKKDQFKQWMDATAAQSQSMQ